MEPMFLQTVDSLEFSDGTPPSLLQLQMGLKPIGFNLCLRIRPVQVSLSQGGLKRQFPQLFAEHFMNQS